MAGPRRGPRVGGVGRVAPRGATPLALLALGLLAACANPEPPGMAGAASSEETAAPTERLIVVVRHAEKVDDGRDPALSEAGAARAAALAELLADAGIERVLSTDYIRTRETARPTAEAAGVDVELYDPADLPGLSAMLLDAPDRAILVVGHSNTTPALVEALTGEPADFMPEEEYDRLYRVRVGEGGSVTAEVERY